MLLNIHISIFYETRFGQNLCIKGKCFSDWNDTVYLSHSSEKKGIWEVSTFVDSLLCDDHELEFKFLIEENGHHSWESGPNRKINIKNFESDNTGIQLQCNWQCSSNSEYSIYSTKAFSVLFKSPTIHKVKEILPSLSTDLVTIKLITRCSTVGRDNQLRVTGNIHELGLWNCTQAITLSNENAPYWETNVTIEKSKYEELEYKFLFFNKHTGHVTWEDGFNRKLPTLKQNVAVSIVQTDFRQEQKIRVAGLAIPVFSLRTQDSFGVGEFLDIRKLVDLSASMKIKLIQILPVIDTSVNKSWVDSYPYSSLSVFALHPQYINLEYLTDKKEILKKIQKEKENLNKFDSIQYEEVMDRKNYFLKLIFENEKKIFKQESSFLNFFEENKKWLKPYALFCYFRDLYHTSNFNKWKENTITMEEIEELTSENSPFIEELNFTYYVQFNLHKQLLCSTTYAKEKNICIKGDIPIGINRHSVDSWVNPTLFRMNKSTGAPPDFFAEDGQNWGFPTYNWENMKQDGYQWWKERLYQMDRYFDVYRIDHILGFFRIWELPEHCNRGLLGRFYPSIPLWKNELREIGIWDFDRLTKPYIRSHTLYNFFGDKMDYIKKKYFNEYEPYCFEFKKEFSTEQKIDEIEKETEEVKSYLIKLLQNIVLIEDEEDTNKFYPRIDFIKCSSFIELSENLQHELKKKYQSYYYERQDEIWSEKGRERLPMMQEATNMLVCGEDLGMIPTCVEPIMRELNLTGLRIQRMPSDLKEDWTDPKVYDYLTVATPSCHDSSTIRGWWESERSGSSPLIQQYFTHQLGFHGHAPYFCETWVTERIVQQHLDSESLFAIFPLQDLFALNSKLSLRDPKEEQINKPEIAKHHWKYRIHFLLEELINDHDSWKEQIRNLITLSGRSI